MFEPTNYNKVPNSYMIEGVKRYVEEGGEIGHFLTALFSNDLIGTFSRADSSNREKMWDWVKFLWNEVPSNCWGSREQVIRWQKKGGKKGLKSISDSKHLSWDQTVSSFSQRSTN